MSATHEKKPATGIRLLARDLGVSTATISRALNDRYGVNAKMRAKVLAAAHRIGYVPNAAARRLKEHPILNIGMFFAPYYSRSQEVNPSALELIKMVGKLSAEQGLGFDVINYTGVEALEARLDQARINVAVFLGQFDEAAYRAAYERNVPGITLAVNSGLESQVAVLDRSWESCQRAVEYMVALGHERIALINGPTQAPRNLRFNQAFVQAMNEFRIPARDEWMIELERGRTNAEGSNEVTRRLLQGAVRPTAIVYGSDWMAIGGHQAVKDQGLRVGVDVSMTGYDNLPVTAQCDPPLTTFDIHTPTLARIVVRLALELGQDQQPTGLDERNIIYVTPHLIKRASCGCIRPRPVA